jgi:hypothetical protein
VQGAQSLARSKLLRGDAHRSPNRSSEALQPITASNQLSQSHARDAEGCDGSEAKRDHQPHKRTLTLFVLARIIVGMSRCLCTFTSISNCSNRNSSNGDVRM